MRSREWRTGRAAHVADSECKQALHVAESLAKVNRRKVARAVASYIVSGMELRSTTRGQRGALSS